MSGCSRIAPFPAASTGNDLVSLEATRPERTTLPRFYSRILTAAEQDGYCPLEPYRLPFDHYVWLCWSVKEAVYKYQKRQIPELVFSPLRISIRQIVPPSDPDGFYQATVEGAPTPGPASTPGPVRPPADGAPAIADGASAPSPANSSAAALYARSLIRDGVIVTTVCDNEAFAGTYWGFSSIDSPAYADQSAAVRTLLLGELETVLSRDDLRLQKDPAGCPIVLAGDQPLAIPVSLAHHHRHIAYSYRLPDHAAQAQRSA